MSQHASFTRMDESTQEDWDLIGQEFKAFAGGLVDRVIAHLRLLDGDYGGFPIDRLSHCLQSATLAYRDGRDDEYVVCALLHDIGDTLGAFNHPEIAAAILKPFVSAENHWMIENHGVFQGHNFFHYIGMDRDMRDMYLEHPCYERTREFVDCYDNPAFDPKGEILPLEFFEPMLRKVFAKPKNSIYQRATERLMQDS